MTFGRLLIQSFRYYARANVATLAGAAIASAVLTGALFAGDSVRQSLLTIALQRLGNTHYAIAAPNRFFADSLAASLRVATQAPMAAVLDLPGIVKPAVTTTEGTQLNQAHLLGVDAEFWTLAVGDPIVLGPGEVAINEAVAKALQLAEGGEIAVRAGKPSLMPGDAPLSERDDETLVRISAKVKAIVPDAQLGRFSLAANQAAPYNVFLDRAWLQQWIERPGQANLLLAGGTTQEILDAAVKQSWNLEAVGLRLRSHPSGITQLESSRIFLDPAVVNVAQSLPGASGVLSYLVNGIACRDKSTPYSFAIAGGPGADLASGQADINRWTAERLNAGPGDTIRVKYYVLSPSNAFSEHEHEFTVRKVVEMEPLAVERDLMSVFPGLTDVERCADWKIGMPMDDALLRDADNEAYWKAYGATPKLMVSLGDGQALWGNRFGAVTGMRFSAQGGDAAGLHTQLQAALDPKALGLAFQPVRTWALDAASKSIDFGGLFLGMSFFLIVAALMLTALLFVLAIERRGVEMGVLLATGFRPAHIRFLVLAEAAGTAFIGSLIGALAAEGYTRLLLLGLAHGWSAAVAGTPLAFYGTAQSMVAGPAASFVCGVLAMAWVVRRQVRRDPVALLRGEAALPLPVRRPRRSWVVVLGGAGMALAAASAILLTLRPAQNPTEAFFGIGSLFLISALAAFSGWLRRSATSEQPRALSLPGLALRNVARRPGRSLTVAALIACGCFMVFAVASMQEDLGRHAGDRASGTGGFALYAESTLPLRENPETALGMPGVRIVPVRLHAGDEASCLNLNHAQQPPLLGVDMKRLEELGAFVPSGGARAFYAPLGASAEIGAIPGVVGDSNTAMWALGKGAGDVLSYRGETGDSSFQVQVAGVFPTRLSVFQGRVLIDEAAFTRQFPSESGYRAFLIDAPADQVETVARKLNARYERYGLEAVPAVDRLYRFYSVEQAYLAIFLALGALALMLGGAGAAVVVLRNLFERRAELALLRATGYPAAKVLHLLLLEQLTLLGAGCAAGGVSALFAMIPLWVSTATRASAPGTLGLMLITAAVLLFSVLIAIAAGFERKGFAALREE